MFRLYGGRDTKHTRHVSCHHTRAPVMAVSFPISTEQGQGFPVNQCLNGAEGGAGRTQGTGFPCMERPLTCNKQKFLRQSVSYVWGIRCVLAYAATAVFQTNHSRELR